MQNPASPDEQPLPPDADSAAESQPDASWSLGTLASYAKGEVANSKAAEELAILQAKKSAVHLFRAGHALFLARAKCKDEKHGSWVEFKRQYRLAGTSANDAIRLFENAKTEEALDGLGITEAKMKFVYPPKAVTSPASPVKKPTKKAAKTSTQQPTTAVAQGANSPQQHAQSHGTTIKPRPASPDPAAPGDDESDPASAPEEPEVSFTTALIEELEEIAQRLAEIAQDDIGKAIWTKAEAQQASNAVASMCPTLKSIQRRLPNEDPID